MTIYLYVKTHNVTGLKYLGKTEQIDPHKYTGSGKNWCKHLEHHGYDYSTQILLATEDKEELKDTGLFFSKLWNVVRSREWANRIPESGEGIAKNTTTVKDKTGKKFNISIFDEKYLNGEYVGHTKGKTVAYDQMGIKVYVNSNDPRFITGELRGNNKSKIYIFKDDARKMIYKTDLIPDGWNKGDNREKKNKGKIWITNGIESSMIFLSENIIPDGWTTGRKMSLQPNRRICVTDGIEIKKLSRNDIIPDGWIKVERKSKIL